jgi:His-Xaa-Ser system radical SAM maturase HxsC
MHKLDAKVQLGGWAQPTLLKVAALPEFASGLFALERMVLDLRDPKVRKASHTLSRLPWAGFLVNDLGQAPSSRPWIVIPSEALDARPGDVIEVVPETSKVALRYRRGANNNILFATERCNSFCLMCSQPPRDIADDWRVSQICALTELIDKNEPTLTITGGEPTLLAHGLNRIIKHCANVLPQTQLHVLSNGRNFGGSVLASSFTGLHPALMWGIPLYGDHYGLHDYVVQSKGAFAETMRGLYTLEGAEQRIEIRVVLVKPVVEHLPALVRFLYRNLPFVEHVAFMGTEPTGFARANRDELWIDPSDMSAVLAESVDYLTRRDMRVSLYNLPLCTLPRSLWPYARRSISDWKQHYLPACRSCAVKERCGGLFAWVTPEWTSRELKPVLEGEEQCASH